MSKGGRYSRKKQPKAKKSPVLTILIILVIVLVFAIAGLVGILVYESFMDRGTLRQPVIPSTEVTIMEDVEETAEPLITETTEAPTTLPYTQSGKDIINILLIGDSARKGETKENYHLADTMMLASVNKKTKTLTLISFLRDSYVKLPAYKTSSGWNRINVAYHLGYLWGDAGGAMMKVNECIKENFGIEVDYNVEVDFEAFIDIVYLLGGVTVELSEEEAQVLNKEKSVERDDYAAGWNWLGGPETLVYARMRKVANTEGKNQGDITRTSRQRTVITQLINQAKGITIEQAQELLNVILPAVTTNMTNEEIKTCMWEILPILGELTIQSEVAPHNYWSKNIGTESEPSYALEFNREENYKYFQPITEGIVEEESAKNTDAKQGAKDNKASNKSTGAATVSWDQILWKVNSAEKGSTLTIDLGGYTYIANNIIKVARNSDITLTIQWDGGEDITVKPTDEIDLTMWRVELSDIKK